jgi:hypothetical protein
MKSFAFCFLLLLGSSAQPIGKWLKAVDPLLTQYADGLVERGFLDIDTLLSASRGDVKRALKQMKVNKPHGMLILHAKTEDEEDKAEPEAEPTSEISVDVPTDDTPPTEWSAFENKYDTMKLRTIESKDWFKAFEELNPEEGKLHKWMRKKKFGKIHDQMCDKDLIATDAKIYGLVPILNWLGQFVTFQTSESLEKLIHCLVQKGVESDTVNVIGTATTDADSQGEGSKFKFPTELEVPMIVDMYRGLPMLLQVTEKERMDLIALLVHEAGTNGANLLVAYPLPHVATESGKLVSPTFGDGHTSITMSSGIGSRLNTGVTALHATMICGDPSNQIQKVFQKGGMKILKGLATDIVANLRGQITMMTDGQSHMLDKILPMADLETLAVSVEETFTGFKKKMKKYKKAKKDGITGGGGCAKSASYY